MIEMLWCLLYFVQYGEAELYYRIVHYRDASVQSLATIAATNRDSYQLAPVVSDL
jgi:hypothetical protein